MGILMKPPATPCSRRGLFRLMVMGLSLGMTWPVTLGAAPALTRKEAYAVFSLLCVARAYWPAATDPVNNKRLTVGVLGRDPDLAAALKRSGRKAQSSEFRGWDIQYLEATKPEELAACHLVFIGELTGEARLEAIAYFKEKPVLLISEADGFLAEGGAVRVRVESESFRYEINLDALKAAGIELPANIRAKATHILFEGVYQPNTNRTDAAAAPGGGDR
jgi:hypothetical protein